MLLGTAIGALSNGIALLSRREETMIAVSNFVLLPMTFLSSVFMAQALMPQWMQDVAQYNPVNWAVQAGRAGLAAEPATGASCFSRLGLACRLHRGLHLAGDARLPRVPALDLTTGGRGRGVGPAPVPARPPVG